MLKTIHITLAYITVLGFAVRAFWSFTSRAQLERKWVKITPHIVDTILLVCGVLLVFNLSLELTSSWLIAKFVGLLAYIGFGVMTLRATGVLRIVGVVGALTAVLYIFMVAYSKSPMAF